MRRERQRRRLPRLSGRRARVQADPRRTIAPIRERTRPLRGAYYTARQLSDLHLPCRPALRRRFQAQRRADCRMSLRFRVRRHAPLEISDLRQYSPLRDLSHCTSAVSSLLIQARRIHHHSSSFTQNKVLFRIYSLADSVFHKATTSLGDQPTLLAKKNKDSSEAQPSPLQTFTP